MKKAVAIVAFLTIAIQAFTQRRDNTATCESLLKHAQLLADSNHFEAAIKKLNAVSVLCPEKGDIVNRRLVKIYTDINDAKKNEAAARDRAETEKNNAVKQARLAASAQLAAEAERNLVVYPADMKTTAQNALEAIKLHHSVQSDRAVRNTVNIIAPLERTVSYSFGTDHAVINNNLFATSGMIDLDYAVRVYNANTNTSFTKKFPGWFIDELAIWGQRNKYIAIGMSDAYGPTYKAEILDTAGNTAGMVTGHGYFKTMAFDVTGQSIALAVDNNILLRYYPATNQQKDLSGLLRPECGEIKEIIFCRDSLHMLVRQQNAISVLNADSNTLVFTYRNAAPAIGDSLHSAFSNDGRLLAVADQDTVHIFGMPGFRPLLYVTVPYIRAICFDNKGRLFTSGANGNLTSWDVQTGRPVNSINTGATTLLHDKIIITPDSKYAITISRDNGGVANSAMCWDLVTGNEAARMYHEQYIEAIAPRGAGTMAVTLGQDHTIKYWKDNTADKSLWHSNNTISAFAVSKDNKYTAIAFTRTRELIVIDNNTRSIVNRMQRQVAVSDVRFSAGDNNDLLMISSQNISIWRDWAHTHTSEELYPFPQGYRTNGAKAVFNKDGDAVAIGFKEGEITILRAPLWHNPQKIDCHTRLTLGEPGIALSAAGNFVAAGVDNGIAVFDTRTGKQVFFTGQPYLYARMIFTPDEKNFIYETPKTSETARDIALTSVSLQHTGDRTHLILPDKYIGDMTVSNKGNILAVGFGKFVRLYRLPDKKHSDYVWISEIDREQTVGHCMFTNDDRYIFSATGNSDTGNEYYLESSPIRPEDLIKALEAKLGK